MTTTETPPAEKKREPVKADTAMTKLGIGLVVVLVLLGVVVAINHATAASPPLLLANATPTRVTVPSIGASSSLIALGQNPDGSLAVPPLSEPMQASWYDKSPTPGAIGPAVILGHINGNGKPGIFFNLGKLQTGQEIDVDRADGQTAVFIVSHVDTVPKSNFPTNDVYGDTEDAQLRLITCGGVLDRAAHNYLSNVVVYASLASVRKT